MQAHVLDDIDIQLLNALQSNARIKRQELAHLVNLSIPAVSERLRKLKEAGYIIVHATHLEPHLCGLDVTAFVIVQSTTSIQYQEFTDRVNQFPEILECHSVTGDGSHILKIRTENTRKLESVLSEIQRWPGVTRTKSNIVLSTYKETLAVPLGHLMQKAN
ncbi:MAG: Lrp/AsnC family transcriptional regulator [Candidatus Marinimicrobia bacterium]|nr:Lrp/AsnC family transcriptional regulator [Candidatus Neomarinimicrobiota bacterium]MCF7839611.1 Lrp/AsnC family transcriptional regulator [Candidatus Neomarinimicrobiota bacterium]